MILYPVTGILRNTCLQEVCSIDTSDFWSQVEKTEWLN